MELNSEATGSTQTDEQDILKLNRKQRRRLMQQNLGPEMQATNTEPVTETSEMTDVNVNMPVSSAAISEVSRVPISSERSVDYRNESSQNEQTGVNSDRNGNPGNVAASLVGSGPVAGSGSTTNSGSIPNSAPVRAPLPAVYQQQLLQQQAQLQQLRLAQATGLLRSPLASQPVILLGQLTQLRRVQQQLAAQQQLLQKQPQTNTMQAQQLALQQQQIGAMMQQIQQQLIQQQQLQQQQSQQQQQQMGSNQFPTPTQQTLLTAQPQQLQQLLLQQRKQQQQQMAQSSKQTQLQPGLRTTEPDTNSGAMEDSSVNEVKSVSPRTTIAKEPTSLVQVVNSAPASPSTGKSRLGQWTQNSIQTERLSPKLLESGGRDRNLRPSPDTSEKSSLLITRSTNSPNSIQTTSNSAPVHRVLDPVSSKWGIDAAPKLSAEPPEFKPGVPWRPYQPKATTDISQSEPFVSTAKTGVQDWPGNAIGSQTVSSTFVNTNAISKTEVTPLKTVPNSHNYSQNSSSAIWQAPQAPVSRQTGVPRPTPLTSNIRPPPGLGDENSFLNLPDVQSQSRDSNWSAHSEPQITNATQFGIRAPGFQPWPTERRDAGWPGPSSQSLDTLPSVPRTNEFRNLAMLGDSTADGAGMRAKPEMSTQQSPYHAWSTWLVIRGISPRVSLIIMDDLRFRKILNLGITKDISRKEVIKIRKTAKFTNSKKYEFKLSKNEFKLSNSDPMLIFLSGNRP